MSALDDDTETVQTRDAPKRIFMGREARFEAMLRQLQLDVEAGSPAQQRRGRLVLKGFRAAVWCALTNPSVASLTATLRHELFGTPVPDELFDQKYTGGHKPKPKEEIS